jgi:riboflavin biosynthesis pyrimidine reductase
VIFDTSMSLDGFMTAANVRPEEPLGNGGQQLHEWAMSGEDDRNRKYLEEAIAALQEQARAAAGDKDVSVMGGASIGQQYIAAGLVDEIQIHLAPVLLRRLGLPAG